MTNPCFVRWMRTGRCMPSPESNRPAASTLDGENLADTLLGKSKASRQTPIFWRRPPDRPGFGNGFDEDNPDLAVRDGKWKFSVNYDGSSPQLYDLSDDISETRNIADEHSEVAERLKQALAAAPASAASPPAARP